MRTVGYEFALGPNAFLRVLFETHKGRVLGFVIQLECFIHDNWHIVVRYDTAHGFAHSDMLHPSKPERKIDLNIKDYNDAFTFARRDIAARWQFYCERYSKWLKEEKD